MKAAIVKPILIFLALFIPLYLIALIISAPASLLKFVLPENAPVTLSGYEGTLWNGKINSLQFDEAHIQHIGWKLDLFALFSAKGAVEIEIRDPNLTASSYLSLDLEQNLALENTRAVMESAFLGQFPDFPLILSGTFFGQFPHIQTNLQTPDVLPTLEGDVIWRQASVPDLELELGEIEVLVQGDASKLSANISDRDGPVKMNGEFNATDDRRFQFNMNLKPTNNATPATQESLGMLGKPNRQGIIRIKQRGKLKSLGL